MRKFSEEWWAARDQRGRCTAHNRDGSRHRLPAIRGATVCRRHGGAAPQVRRRAAERVETQTALQWAERELQREGIRDQTPLEHLQETLTLAAYTYHHWRLACGTLMQEGRSTWMGRDRHGQLVLHPYVQAREAALQVWTRVAKYALEAKVAERLARVREQEGELLIAAAEAAFLVMGKHGASPAAIQAGRRALGLEVRKLGDIQGQARLKA